jgi:hypothetical protein
MSKNKHPPRAAIELEPPKVGVQHRMSPAKTNAVEKPKQEPKVAARTVTMEDFYAALTDRYPHHDIRSTKGRIAEVSVPGGMIEVDREKAMGCATVAELRAYIDSLPVL